MSSTINDLARVFYLGALGLTTSDTHDLDYLTSQFYSLYGDGISSDVYIKNKYGLVGDGVVDDTVALQAFFTAAGSTGGDFKLPKGTYKVTTSVTVTPTVRGRIYAYGAIIKVGTSFPVGGIPAYAVLFITGSNLSIQGLCVDGNNVANRGISILDSSSHIKLYDCEVKNMAQQATETDVNTVGIRLEGNCNDIDIERCYIHNITTGAGNSGAIAGFARGILISGNTVTWNVKVRGCTFENITWTGVSADADGICIQNYLTSNTYLLVDGCSFKNIYKRAVKIQCAGVTVSNCTIENDYTGASGVNTAPNPQVFAAISVYASDCIISHNNIIGGAWFQGIEIGATGTTVNRVVVTGNKVSGGSGTTMTGSGGIRVRGDNTCSEYVIANNYIGRFSQSIWLSTAAIGVNVTGNVINGYSVAATAGVYIDGDSSVAPTRPIISNNSFEGITRYGIELNIVPTDLIAVGNMAGRAGFEVISAGAFSTPASKRTYAIANAGAGSVSGGLDGGQGSNLNQGGVLARVLKYVTPITYSASMTPDSKLGDWQTITATNGTAFTINAPTNPPTSGQSQRLSIEILNSSGGALGAITWNAAFVFAGLTWTSPANTFKRNAVFDWNGTKWICTQISAADY